MMFATVQDVVPHIQSGKLRALAVTTKDRSVVLPDVPTVNESAGVPNLDYDVSAWFGVTVRSGVPAPVIQRLNQEINKSLEVPDVRRAIREQGAFIPDTPGSADSFDAYLKSEIARWGRVIKEAGIAAD